MNIAFFTQGGYQGKVPRHNSNMRTDQAWVCALDAVHYPIHAIHVAAGADIDVAIVIIPKEGPREQIAKQEFDLIGAIRSCGCKKVLVMQESTHWDWQDGSFAAMVWYHNQLTQADAILCHNDIDLNYFTGITNKPAYICPTLMIEDSVADLRNKEGTDKVFVAGNWHTTYRGFDAWVISNEFELPMLGFRSGKFKDGEETNGVNYLPWMDWKQFMTELSSCKYGVQTYQASAGQFPLNCAYVGTPCIGYNDINTQKDLFPDLSVVRGDVLEARKLVSKLTKDKGFYQYCVDHAITMYDELYTEEVFKKNMNLIINSL